MSGDDSRVPFTPTLFGGCFLCDSAPEILFRDVYGGRCLYYALCWACADLDPGEVERKFRRLFEGRDE